MAFKTTVFRLTAIIALAFALLMGSGLVGARHDAAAAGPVTMRTTTALIPHRHVVAQMTVRYFVSTDGKVVFRCIYDDGELVTCDVFLRR